MPTAPTGAEPGKTLSPAEQAAARRFEVRTTSNEAMRDKLLREGPPPEGDDAEVLNDGQEEVFSRGEVELGRIEHKVLQESKPADDE